MMGPLVFGSVFTIVLIVGYLDYRIRERFSGEIHTRPAHLYSRPVAIEAGQRISSDQVVALLRERNYRQLDQALEPGTFTRYRNGLDIALRHIDVDIEAQPAGAARLAFVNDRIDAMSSLADAAPIQQFYLEPVLVGSLQLGAYEDRISLQLHQFPQSLIEALLVMEDRDFQQHLGIDPGAIGRALWFNLRHGRAVQGGSTLTQQLVKNLFLSPRRTMSRKGLEALMAIIVEMRFSKAEILELYLNEIFLGQSGNRAVHGFALASEYFFDKPVDQLQLHEVATLVGMVPAPSHYNPRRHPQRAAKRRNLVLATLVEHGFIDHASHEKYAALPLQLSVAKRQTSSEHPAYTDYLHRQLRQYYAEDVLRNDGLRLYTSMDPGIQRITQQALGDTLAELEKETRNPGGSLQGAAIVVDIGRGEIIAMTGDRKKGYSGFNRAIDAHRPIGSLVKPVVYLTALEDPGDYSLATWLEDTPLTVTPKGGEAWSPQNYDKQFRGETILIESLVHSYNVPTVRLGLKLGVDKVIDTLHRLGIEREVRSYPSILLGAGEHSPLEIAQVYQVLANAGLQLPLRAIRTIQNSDHQTIARFPVRASRVIEPEPAYLLDFALKQVVRRGTAARLSTAFGASLELAGKTGTTDNYRDSWFAGYSGNLLTVVWVGRDDNKPVGLTGSSGAMRVWQQIMSRLHLHPTGRIAPDGVEFLDIDASTGLLANDRCEQRMQLPFVAGQGPDLYAGCAGVTGQLKNWFNIRVLPDLDAVRPERKDPEQKSK